MQGHNAEYLEQLYARYANDPNAVDEAWQAFFQARWATTMCVKPKPLAPHGRAPTGRPCPMTT